MRNVEKRSTSSAEVSSVLSFLWELSSSYDNLGIKFRASETFPKTVQEPKPKLSFLCQGTYLFVGNAAYNAAAKGHFIGVFQFAAHRYATGNGRKLKAFF